MTLVICRTSASCTLVRACCWLLDRAIDKRCLLVDPPYRKNICLPCVWCCVNSMCVVYVRAHKYIYIYESSRQENLMCFQISGKSTFPISTRNFLVLLTKTQLLFKFHRQIQVNPTYVSAIYYKSLTFGHFG